MSRTFRPTLHWALIAAILLLVVIWVASSAATPALQFDANAGRPDEATIAPEALVPLAGVQSDDGAIVVLSPVSEAPRPFSYMLLKWQAATTVSGTLKLELRASADGNDWSEWGEVLENPDLYDEAEPDMFWSQTIYAGEGQRFWQARAMIRPDPEGVLPTLGPITVGTVDPASFPAPVGDPPAEIQSEPGKPAVISRTAWGCPDGQGSRVSPSYRRITHMIVHHTADQNSLRSGEANWAARVRAEWSFHTNTRGWGDVGYNYLIDPNGVVYEGRAGGDDAVGFHDTGNFGSLGVVLIGTYSTVAPRQAAVDSLVNLLAWKSAQRGIDPTGRGYYYGCDISSFCSAPGAILDNIAGHRHVTPRTSCPGDQIVNLLPSIRSRVKERVNGGGGGGGGGGAQPVPDNGDLLIDNLEQGSYAYSPATWYEASCGEGNHTFYSFATDNAADSSNSATWRPNIGEAGSYRVYARIPQGCGLYDPPYASSRALYRIRHANGSSERSVDQNIGQEWADLGVYSFNAGSDGAVELYDYPGEPYGERKVLFFDAVKWVKEANAAQPKLQLLDVSYSATELVAGQLLKVSFKVKNIGNGAAQGQAPQTAGSAGDYVYDEGECFLGDAAGSYPAYVQETGRFRGLLGMVGQTLGNCKSDDNGYPWRWGLSGRLEPGQETTISGYVRFRTPGTYQLHAGGAHENVAYFAQGQFPQTISVRPEQSSPAAAQYDDWLQPLAAVYRLGAVPDNFLARASHPLAVPRGESLGSFAWDGTFRDWGLGGPLGQTDNFVIEQTRVFYAPVAGRYRFRTLSDDGSWLWVDGTLVVTNAGLRPMQERSGEVELAAGLHVVAFRYFERDGGAGAGYSVRYPGHETWSGLGNALGSGALELQGTFTAPPALALTADDLGGSGVNRIRYTLDGSTWGEQAGGLVQLGQLVNGSYTLRYQAVDEAGNAGPEQTLSFRVDSGLLLRQGYLPVLVR